MSPELSEKLLGISIDGPSDHDESDGQAQEDEELERFVFFAIGDQRLAVPVDDVKTITKPPEDVTRVPRSPEAVDGVVDFRGEITAVIQPRVHFPASAPPSLNQRLLVFDRPTDQQPAAIRVDDVLGVETVPVSDVLERAELDDVDEGALEHPLVAGLVRQEQRAETSRFGGSNSDSGPRSRSRSNTGSQHVRTETDTNAEGESKGGFGLASGRGTESSGDRTTDSSASSLGSQPSLTAAREQTSSEEFDRLESLEEEDEGAVEDEESEPKRLVTVTALIDVDRLLLAAGQTA